MVWRRTVAALALPLALAAAGSANAQQGRTIVVRAPEPPAPSAPAVDLTRQPGADRNVETIAALPLLPNAELRLGRFRVHDIARPRTNLEPEPGIADRRGRGIAAIGFSLRF